ncbi:HU family DNA-binding protein [Marinagarivorans algicola]|uniref:HU family DNA-binding protein n=1 Tax=Marinagarivorans algicola TaxID=1513270 RepID=UPI0006B472DD|nr:HU family DNA-binding protein [Marinagarivorans algicola]
MPPRKAPAKAPVRKAPARKAAVKAPAKAPVRKAAAKPAPAAKVKALKALQERYTKTDIINRICEVTELNRKDVIAVFGELDNIIEAHIKKRAVGEFTLPGLLKIVTVKKPATKARKGINPFNGEETIFKAKPASIAVKVRPLKKLKEMAL